MGLLLLAGATWLCAGCSGESERAGDAGVEVRAELLSDGGTEVEATADVSLEAGDVPSVEDAQDQSTDGSDTTGTGDAVPDAAEAEAAEEPEFVAVSETTAAAAEPTCDDCFVISHDTWDGSWEPEGPSKGEYDVVQNGVTIYFRPWMRFRMPHPGKVKRIYMYTAGGAGQIEMQLSTGFPGGHYPCLNENTGEDLYPIGEAYRMDVGETPGWRVFDVQKLGHELLGYDEFFVIFRHIGEARVALSLPAPREPGDYESYGGLIADIPGDTLTCFPSMSNFVGADDVPLVWLMRAEIVASEVVEQHVFDDLGALGPQVGGHVSFGDYDNDGDEDFLSGGTLWRNDGTGQFLQVTEEAGLAGVGGECVWGDYDNDGNRDIVCVGGTPFLVHNEGDGSFIQVTQDAGIVMAANNQGVTWFDANGDGFLDFYAATYGTLADSEKPFRDFFFYNNGDGTFTDKTKEYGIPVTPLYWHGRGVCAADYDGDGDSDVYVGNYRLDPNQLWQNKGATKGFADKAKEAGVMGVFNPGMGGSTYGHTIGPSFGELNGDGLFDLVVPNLAHPRFIDFSDQTWLYFNKGDGTFEGFQPPEKGVVYDETHSDSVLFDYDNDGDLDLFLTAVYEGRRSYLYANDSKGEFTDQTYLAGIRHFNGWGAAAGDVDGDGDLDLIANRLFVNESAGAGPSLQVKLTGGASPEGNAGWSNRDAIGAIVKVQAGGKLLVRQVEGGKGVGCQNSSVLHFGLGAAPEAESVTVLWPSGKTTQLAGVTPGLIEVNEKE